MEYINYHKHSCYSNIRTPDSAEKIIDYINRAKELNSNIYSTVEHGFQGNIFDVISLCEENNMHYIYGAEMYYVPSYEENSEGKKDKSNNHIIVIAKNNEGFKQINKALSIANTDGYYYKPRINDDILFNLFKPNDVIITTACIAGIGAREDYEELISKLKDRFGKDLYLEVQSHNHIAQINHNKRMIKLAKEYDIELIHANDSHYIDEEGEKYRDIFLKGKEMFYGDENSFQLDYPSSEEILDRYKIQGVLTKEESIRALNNTLIFKECINVANIDKKIKLPSVSDNPTQELKNIINKEFRNKGFDKYPKDKRQILLKAVREEMQTITDTKMENYFIMDYKICKSAQEDYGGIVTRTGRGSAVSFIINKLLNLTEINRVFAPVPLYPSRFMSTERILSANSLPDIDINVAQQEPFIKATEKLVGKENCAWMLSYKPLQDKSAFRLYCKGIGLKVSEYDSVSKDLDLYKGDSKWKDIIEKSKKFIGVIESISPSPCSMIVYDKDISEEIGLIKTTDQICCLLDGINCDKYKYLKNDILKVSVWDLIRNVCLRADIPIPSITELETKLDKKTWDIYANGITCTVNQADSDFATNLVKEYKPTSVAEMSAFVRAIRPGFASLLDNFIKRKPYTTNVPELDELLEDSFHYLMYQESIMKYLIWLGIDESKTYTILKKIAKKKFKAEELEILHSTLKENWKKKIGSEDNFEETWQVVEDASRYSFNASHSLSYAYDSIYCAYLKSHYPFEYYAEALNMYSDDTTRTAKMTNELKYFNIKLENPSFINADYNYSIDKENRIIYKGMNSIKYLNEKCCKRISELSKNKPNDFITLLNELKGYANSRQIDVLIGLGFFEYYGKSNKLRDIVKLYDNVYSKKQFKKEKIKDYEDIFRKYSNVETEKMFKDVDLDNLCNELSDKYIENTDISNREKVGYFLEYTGTCDLKFSNVGKWNCVLMEKPTRYKRYSKIKLYNLLMGKSHDFKISNDILDENKINVYDLINVSYIEKKPKSKKVGDKWIKDHNDLDCWLVDYEILEKSNV